jgi:hypothetical protein
VRKRAANVLLQTIDSQVNKGMASLPEIYVARRREEAEEDRR